ncbi:DNA binding protein [Mycobacterium phage Rem711]|uniref:HTH DNA-binding protein n=1 Tax=Mycobacterium phage Rem711 TaxID=2079285 RepID=A0A2K9VEW2_9CAUD|nr:DNA binding protein [Mycobacterium phage Rem711]AUV60784.1 HTH DNA-binding protein [Mycobacterium phage Rem711]
MARRKLPTRYLNQAEFAERIGVAPSSLSRYKLPAPDVIVGPVNEDGSLPRGTVRGWLPATIDEWNASRPGRGARTDLAAR